MQRILKPVAAVALVIGGLGLVWFTGMRAKWPPVIDLQRRINRVALNPLQLRRAGQPGAYAGVVHHVGRRSGREFATPVVPYPTGDGFVIALPYGADTDWVRNVLAAGGATIDLEGEHVEVIDPRVIPVEDAPVDFPESEQRSHRTFRVKDCLAVRSV